mgnify:CR=1 FL=1
MPVIAATTGVRVPLPPVSVHDFFLETIVLQQISVGPTRRLVGLSCQEGGWDGTDSLNCRIQKVESSLVLFVSSVN